MKFIFRHLSLVLLLVWALIDMPDSDALMDVALVQAIQKRTILEARINDMIT